MGQAIPSPFAGQGKRLYMQDVAPRDGLQIEAAFVPTEHKIALIDALSQCGLAKIEATSFVSPAAIPALRDAEGVMNGITRVPGVMYTVLVPNARGADRALACRADEFNLVMSASESHNLANLRMTREQSYRQLAQVARIGVDGDVAVNASLSCSFGCPMEGDVPERVALDWCARLLDTGATGISLCDTTGMAYPAQVHSLVTAFRARFPDAEVTMHFHNTRGMGLANVLASISAGADRFDASLGGLGGCPYAPGASGNVCTEDLVHALSLMGYDTGVDLPRLLACSKMLPPLVGHEVPGQVGKAGQRLDLHPVPKDFDEIRARAHARDQRPN